jgi:eukaryotic-like serine/threonine-protein kinase
MTPPPLVGTVLDGKFRIDKALASGASGDVYEAHHLGLGSQVAVKVLRPGIPETAHIRRKRFVREARVAARIQSDHVVRVFDIVAPEEGLIYIVMELLSGETLADRIKRVGPMSPAEAVGYLIQAASPLAQMHDEGIVHRDVKPSNVFLARDAEGRERIKLLDFGVAAFQQPLARGESSITLTDAIVGTPRYMAPEQVRASKEVDARADVWALGVTLYELLAGSPPFDGQTVLAVLNQIEQQEPRLLAERQPGVSMELAQVVHRCLAKDPARRPADARALAEALAPFAGESSSRGDVPSARRPSDPVDLSLSDENVEVVAGRAMSKRAPITRFLATRKFAVAAVAIAGVLYFLATSKRPNEANPSDPIRDAPSLAPTAAAASGVTAVAEPAPPLTNSLVTTEPVRDGATAHRALEPSRAPSTPKRSARPLPHPTNKVTRPPSEDDDRIE